MSKPWTTQDAAAYLKAHPPRMSYRVIASRTTSVLLSWGAPVTDRVSRPMASMVARGRAGQSQRGLKAHAIWEALRQLNVIPRLPAEFANETPSIQSLRRIQARVNVLQAKLRNRDEEVVEIPMLTKSMLQYFGFERNPVYDEVRSSRDLWWGPQHLEAQSILLEAAEEGRFVRLAGRRGAGKTQVWRAVREELARRDDVVLVETSGVIAKSMAETDLMSAVIQGIKRKVDGREEVYPEAQNRQKRALAMRYLLINCKRNNRKVVLAIEEAHELKAQTFLSLKRFLDEVDGIGRRLLGIILIGQLPDAAYDPRTRDLSEVLLRLQTYRLQPMNDQIPDYLRFKIQRAGAKPSEVITPQALKAIGSRSPYPLDANSLFAQLVISAHGDRKKPPIGRDLVEATVPELEPEAEEAAAL